jgi:hypothetical protein
MIWKRGARLSKVTAGAEQGKPVHHWCAMALDGERRPCAGAPVVAGQFDQFGDPWAPIGSRADGERKYLMAVTKREA